MDKHSITIDLNKFIASLSLALDLAEACALKDRTKAIDFNVSVPDFSVYNHDFSSHSKKTALISIFIAKALGYTYDKLNNIYIASFLHDIGAVDAFNSCHSDKSFIYEHSEFGSEIVKKLPINKNISKYIKYHHENFDGSGPNALDRNEIPEESHIIHFADMIELIISDKIPYRLQKNKIISWVKEKKGKLFSPTVVDAFLVASENERFWLDIENINFDSDILARMSPKLYTSITLAELTDISRVFATIIDKKSRFTHQHSIGLASISDKFCKYYAFDSNKTTMIEIASLLHDLGKLSIPNEILDKPDKLTDEEFTIIKSHTYYTKLILDKISGMEEISQWASNHHETLKGTGYPERLRADDLSLESRIIAVSDIYQALTEDRPYRLGMPTQKALSIIDSLVDNGSIDENVVRVLKEII